jgi:hypothetical protein
MRLPEQHHSSPEYQADMALLHTACAEWLLQLFDRDPPSSHGQPKRVR